MATDPESNEILPAILLAMQLGLGPCEIAAMMPHVKANSLTDVIAHEHEVIFGLPKAEAPPPAARPEVDAPST